MGANIGCYSPKNGTSKNLKQDIVTIQISQAASMPPNPPDILKDIVKCNRNAHIKSGLILKCESNDTTKQSVDASKNKSDKESANITKTESSFGLEGHCMSCRIPDESCMNNEDPHRIAANDHIKELIEKSRQRSHMRYYTEITPDNNEEEIQVSSWTAEKSEEVQKSLNTELRAEPLEILPNQHQAHCSHNRNHVFLEADLLKYHPKFAKQFIKRFCQITRFDFRYYKDKFTVGLHSPIMLVPHAYIESVRRVHIDFPSASQRQITATGKYLFEIFVKPTFWHKKPQQSKCIDASFFAEATELLHVLADNTKKANINDSSCSAKAVKKSFVDKVTFENDEEAKDYIMFVKKEGVGLTNKGENSTGEGKLRRASTNNISGRSTGRIKSKKETENAVTGERLVFCTNSAEECERWIWLLNWAVKKKSV